MTQEEKDLLLKDICGRLPYGVKLHCCSNVMVCIGPYTLNTIILDRIFNKDTEYVPFDEVKPYLLPLSSMTDELWNKEFRGCGITEFTRDSFEYGCETLEFNNDNPNLSSMVSFINQLIKNHFDIYGLIPMGLALDATNLNIYE